MDDGATGGLAKTVSVVPDEHGGRPIGAFIRLFGLPISVSTRDDHTMGTIFALSGTAFLGLLAIAIAASGPTGLDAWVQDAATGATSPALQQFASAWLSAPGHIEVALVLLALGVAFCIWVGRPRTGALMAGSGLASVALVTLIKPAIGRPRPGGDLASFAFPSGHATTATAIVGLVLFLGLRSLSGRAGPDGPRPVEVTERAVVSAFVAWVGLIVMTGAGRILAGVHWFTDVLGAYALGVAIVAATLWAHPLADPGAYASGSAVASSEGSASARATPSKRG